MSALFGIAAVVMAAIVATIIIRIWLGLDDDSYDARRRNGRRR